VCGVYTCIKHINILQAKKHGKEAAEPKTTNRRCTSLQKKKKSEKGKKKPSKLPKAAEEGLNL